MERRYLISKKACLYLSQGDITLWSGDAIVNAANEQMLGGGGVDGAIHRCAGPSLRDACEEVPEVSPGIRCPTGEARITSAGEGNLSVPFVIHTVGPVYQDEERSASLLRNAYKSVLTLANKRKLKSIAFPAISCGVFGYPIETAAEIAIRSCIDAIGTVEEIHFVLFNDHTYDAWRSSAEESLKPLP